MLFVKSERSIQLKSHLQGIIFISTAINSSVIVFLKKFNISMILQINNDGEQLFRLTINQGENENQLVMINNCTVAVTNYEESQIKIIDLKTYNVKKITHMFCSSSKINLFYFQATMLICVAQSLGLKITYYSLEGERISDADCFKQSLQNMIDYESTKYNYFKGNRESMIVCQQRYNFIKELNQNCFICIGPNGLLALNLSPRILVNQSFQNCNQWLPQAIRLYYVAYSFDSVNFYCKHQNQLSKDKAIRGRGFHLGKHTFFIIKNQWPRDKYKCAIIKNSNTFGNYSYIFYMPFIVFHYETMVKNIELAYPSQQSEAVIIPEYLQNQNVIKITEIRESTIKEIQLHFMLHLNEDFDDDLLFDASELLEAEKRFIYY